jgi:hypothetical protein
MNNGHYDLIIIGSGAGARHFGLETRAEWQAHPLDRAGGRFPMGHISFVGKLDGDTLARRK